MRRRRALGPTLPGDRTSVPPGRVRRPGVREVLILSASMGAGHDGAAHELARRLSHAGHGAVVRDFLDAGPLRVGRVLRRGYEIELRHAPSAYDATYRFWHRAPWLCPAVAWVVCALTRRRVLRWVRRQDADVVVSTYPLATLCLGRLRRTAALRLPAVNVITDFGVHPLWVHKGIDLNLAVHEQAASEARRLSGRPTTACGPAVSDRFDPTAESWPSRPDSRRRLGLDPADRAVLVVAGSWGVGNLEHTLEAVAAASGDVVAVVVCGHDRRLQARVEALVATRRWRAVVLGWTDDMPALMAASDALVENAGGLTAFEAMRAGLPVISFNPIAGHGIENTAAMSTAGVSRLATTPAALAADLNALTTSGPLRRRQVATASAIFSHDGAVLALAAATEPTRPAVAGLRVAGRGLAATVAVAALTWAGLTTGVGVAAAEGAGVAHPPAGHHSLTYVGVRIGPASLRDAALRSDLVALGASAVVDRATMDADPAAVRDLSAAGVDVVTGGQGPRYDAHGVLQRPAPWTRAQMDVRAARALARLLSEPVRLVTPGRQITAFDLYDSSSAHLSMVVPDSTIDLAGATRSLGQVLHPGAVEVIDATRAPEAALSTALSQLRLAAEQRGLGVVPLGQLR